MKIYLIAASTGCTCYADENFEQGPYTNKEEAQDVVSKWSVGENNPLASQYAKYGRYSVIEYEAEDISGGRFVIGDTVWGPEVEQKPY